MVRAVATTSGKAPAPPAAAARGAQRRPTGWSTDTGTGEIARTPRVLVFRECPRNRGFPVHPGDPTFVRVWTHMAALGRDANRRGRFLCLVLVAVWLMSGCGAPRRNFGAANSAGADAAGADGIAGLGGASSSGTAGSGGTVSASGGSQDAGASGGSEAGGAVDGPPGTRSLAEACSGLGDCASGNCVDGVCCDTACTENCSACNLTNFVGHCSPVPAGSVAPTGHPACVKTAVSTCQQNGLCDGRGTCQLYADGEACAGGTCSTATQLSQTSSSCDGLGNCKSGQVVACSPFKCQANDCATTCAIDSDCQGQPCVAGSCGKVANASKCTTGSQCTSGNCADGYCCDSACSGSCQACDLSGTLGKCSTLAANQTPRNGRAACAAGTCGSRCDGTSAACAVAPKTTSCGTASCTAGVAKGSVTCDGMGACPTAAMTSCGGYACLVSTCKTTCANDSDCLAPTPYCGSNSKCQASKPLGRACTSGTECTAGNCVDGVCCGTASCAACNACNLGTPGTCSGKPASASDSACLASNCQSGKCDGSGACKVADDGAICGTNKFCRGGSCGACMPNQSCTPANPCKNGTTSCSTGIQSCSETTNKLATVLCGASASCSGTTKTNAAVCDGFGTCSASTQSCANGCNPAKTDCLVCNSGQTACSGTCVDTTSNAAHCGPTCNACAPATPICLSSSCVECTSDSYCSGKTPSCDMSSHTCICRQADPGNIIADGGFDKNLGSWLVDPNSRVSWKSEDSEICQGSGSLYGVVASLYAQTRCLPVKPGTLYYFGFKYKYGMTADASVACYLTPYKDSSCSMLSDEEFAPGLGPSRSTSWSAVSTTWVVYADSPYADVSCPLQDASVDQVYLNPVIDSF